MLLRLAASLSIAGVLGLASAQTPATVLAAISGVVVDANTGGPVPGAVVTLRQSTTANSTTRQVSDAQGRFVFLGLQPGVTTTLAVSKIGYEGGGNELLSRGTTVTLDDGEWRQNVTLSLSKPAAIEGMVVDEQGEPIVGVHVQALRVFPIGGSLHYLSAMSARTDDRGLYRLAHLAPGRYVATVVSTPLSAPADAFTRPPFQNSMTLEVPPSVAAGSNSRTLLDALAKPPRMDAGAWWSYPSTYFPSAAAPADAVAIDLNDTETRGGVDFHLSPVRVFSVSGTVSGPPDALADLDVRLAVPGTEGLEPAAVARVGADGRFELTGVPAGSYALEASKTTTEFRASPNVGIFAPLFELPTTHMSASISTGTVGPANTYVITTGLDTEDASWWATIPVAVGDRDVTGVAVSLRPTGTMSGRVDYEIVTAEGIGQSVSIDPANAHVELGTRRLPARADGRFSVSGFLPGTYVVGHEAKGTIKSVRWHGEEHAVTGFDFSATSSVDDVVITLTDNGAGLSGTVRSAANAAAAGIVVLFPVEPDQWRNFGLRPRRILTASAAADGAYALESIPAGEYFVVAVPLKDRDGWQDPAFLSLASRGAIRVSLNWGDHKTQDLVVRPVASDR